jgi:ribonuclease R
MSKEEIDAARLLQYLNDINVPITKREMCKAFGLKGSERIMLKDAIRDLMDQGKIKKTAQKTYVTAGEDHLPAVAVFKIVEVTLDGETFALPMGDKDLEKKLPDPILIDVRGKKSCAEGDRVLVKLKTHDDGTITGLMMRNLGEQITKTIAGRAVQTDKGWIVEPVNKSDRNTYKLKVASDDLIDGHLVEVTLEKEASRGALKQSVATLKSIIGHDDDPKAISLIAMFEKGLTSEFPDQVLEESQGLKVPPLGSREDLRDIPLVTIDGADARDFDDAVFAEKMDDGGFHIIVAIADVAHYVHVDTALGQEALKRGNSTYFPDRVVPMLPEALSNDLCSLRPNEDRACMGFHLYINDKGDLKKWIPFRGLMRSHARLIYEQVQAAFDGLTDELTEPLLDDVLTPIHQAFVILDKARARRGALDINMPERKIDIDETGTMTGVTLRQRFDAHKMIEEFMILANVAAAEALEAKGAPCIYRIHDQPDSDRIDNASNFLEGFGLNLAKGNVPKPSVLNSLLKKVEGEDHAHLVNEVILRSQSQAVYSPDNIGHYGLALTKYGHFTSPIRRYADLIVHRSIIRAYGLGDGGLTDEESVTMADIADHISKTERNSMEAERSAVDRFTASYLETRIASEFTGRISGVTHFGLFVRLDENGADGLIPIKTLSDDYYEHVEQAHALIGRRHGRIFRLCAPVRVTIREADRLTGSCILQLVNPHDGADIPGFVGPEIMMRPTDKPTRSGRSKPYQSRKGRKDDGKRFKKGPSAKKKKTTTPKHKKKQNK